MDRIRGVFVALATPLKSDESVDLEGLENLVEYCIEPGGLQGIIPLGSTGEYYALTNEEKEAVVSRVIATVDGRVPVFIGTNAGGTAEVCRLSLRAQEQGAQGVLLAAPYYSLPNPGELIKHFEAVNKALDIPIMLYNYPARTGVDLTPQIIEELSQMSNIRYVKESTGGSARVSEIIHRCGDNIEVFCGSDSIAYESFLLGAIGWVAGVANVIPQEHVELYRLAIIEKDYDAARELSYKLLPLMNYMEGNGKYTQFVKAACEVLGRPIGPPRMPLQRASESEQTRLAEILRSLSN